MCATLQDMEVVVEYDVSFINGLMFGIEHVNPKGIEGAEDMRWAVVVDLFLVRISIVKWDRED